MIRKYIIPLLSVLLLTGCGVYRHYERPDVRTENLYTQYESSDTMTIADKKWQELFTDPCLQKLMEQFFTKAPAEMAEKGLDHLMQLRAEAREKADQRILGKG